MPSTASSGSEIAGMPMTDGHATQRIRHARKRCVDPRTDVEKSLRDPRHDVLTPADARRYDDPPPQNALDTKLQHRYRTPSNFTVPVWAFPGVRHGILEEVMAKRLYLVGLLALVVSCRSSGTQGDMGSGSQASVDMGRDAIESALLQLGIDGRLLRLDLNTASWEGGRARIARAHLLSSAVLLETDSDKPHVFSVGRAALDVNWYSPMQERAMFPATENADTVFLVSAHYLHALAASTGRRAMMFVGGGLGGLRRFLRQIRRGRSSFVD